MVPASTQSSHTTSGSRRSSRQPAVECMTVSRMYTRGGGGGLLSRGGTDAETVTAVSDISLQVFPGDFVGLAGPSGSGKTTLLHLLAGLDTPTTGTVRLAGTDTSAMSSRRRARLRLQHVGIVFQHFHLLPSLSARANVAVPLLETGHSKRDRRDRATALLEDVGLGDRLQHKPAALSGGERQRVAVARALVTDPDLLIADEPTGELDTETGAQVLDLLESVAADRAVVVASHDEQVLTRVSQVVRLQDGHRVAPAEQHT